MRAGSASRIEPNPFGGFTSLRIGWLQAGFGSFAYRLAHLRASRTVILSCLSIVFFIA